MPPTSVCLRLLHMHDVLICYSMSYMTVLKCYATKSGEEPGNESACNSIQPVLMKHCMAKLPAAGWSATRLALSEVKLLFGFVM